MRGFFSLRLTFGEAMDKHADDKCNCHHDSSDNNLYWT